MFDINFYRKADYYLSSVKDFSKLTKEDVFNNFNNLRSKDPIIYNIETTNACNMHCVMCPRTKMMTRNIETMNKDLFFRIIEQLNPHDINDWKKSEKYVLEKYKIPFNAMSENHFFLYIIPKVIQLHGYGDPLLDKNIPLYIKLLKEKGFSSYFSCNPANIDINKTIEMFEEGLDYIKYSIESVDDDIHKEIRGNASNFSECYKKIIQLLEIKEKNNFDTSIVITMLDLHRKKQILEFKKLKEAFSDLDVYIYFKSEDQQWYRKDYHGTESIHWSEYCKHPWMSMTVKSNGEAAMCMEDFNNEIILGDTKEDTLYDIWNGKRYNIFRKDHFTFNRGIKCSSQCDMKLIGKMI